MMPLYGHFLMHANWLKELSLLYRDDKVQV